MQAKRSSYRLTSPGPRPDKTRSAPFQASPAPGPIAEIRVSGLPGLRARARVVAGAVVLPGALGPAGIVRRKREGDGATPVGSFRLTGVLYRADRIARPRTLLPVRAMRRDDGWCDDVGCAAYNRPVRRPFAGRHEAMWRHDGLYDCVVVIAYNTARIRKGRGSAIFLHVAAPGFRPTAGCVAVRRDVLVRLLRRVGPRTRFTIG